MAGGVTAGAEIPTGEAVLQFTIVHGFGDLIIGLQTAHGWPSTNFVKFYAAVLFYEVRQLHKASTDSNEYRATLLNFHEYTLRAKSVHAVIFSFEFHRQSRGAPIHEHSESLINGIVFLW